MVDWRLIPLCIAGGVAGWFGLKFAFTVGFNEVRDTVSPPSAKVEGEVAKLEREAAKKHPGKSRAEAIALVASDKASQELNAAANPKERAFKAAQIFLGYYMINARGRADYCQKQGVDIAPFVDAFTRRYAREFRLAGEILSGRGIDIEVAYRQIQPAMGRMINTEMQSLASFQATHKRVCETFAKQPGYYLDQIDLQRRQPDVYRALYPS
ncbi:MAG TPA: hypothetical protein VJ890_14285 [Vineibacter sp.]|nr:hypothetical protein [Vineibacter sp.]